MRNVLVIGVLCAAISACASRESLEALSNARAQVRKLQEQIDYASKSLPGIEQQALVSQLKDAKTRSEQLEAEVRREREESRAKITETAATGIETAAPFANGLLPGLAPLLVLAAGALRGFGKKGSA